MKRLLTIITLCMTITPALAHDSWINRQQWRNSAGQWCCGTGDCGVLQDPDKAVETRPDGYHIDGAVTTEGDSVTAPTTFKIQGFVPYGKQLPSPDGQYWVCKGWDNMIRCFFAPPQSY